VCETHTISFFLFIWSGIKKEKLETKNTSGQAETETRTAKTTAANQFSKRTLKMPPLLHVGSHFGVFRLWYILWIYMYRHILQSQQL